MDKNIIARNLLIIKQIEALGYELSKVGIQAVLLKGAALIMSCPRYAVKREMEDIDMLVRPSNLASARELLASLGYAPLPEDPNAMASLSMPVPVDLTDSFWYLNKAENEKLFNDSLKHRFDGMPWQLFHLKPEDFYIHVLAHGAIHHALVEAKWRQDIYVIKDNWEHAMNWAEVEDKINAYGFQKAAKTYLAPETEEESFYKRIMLSENNPHKGHITRFLFLPFGRKVRYLIDTLFPSKEFLRHRYNLNSGSRVMLYRFFRPFFLLSNLAISLSRLLFARADIKHM